MLLGLREVGTVAQTSTELRGTRCFVVPAGDKHVKWIWAAERQPELREMACALRGSGVLPRFGIAVEEDTVPSKKGRSEPEIQEGQELISWGTAEVDTLSEWFFFWLYVIKIGCGGEVEDELI